MTDPFDSIPNDDGTFDQRLPGDPINDPHDPQGLPLDVVDAGPLRGNPPMETRSAPVVPPAVTATPGTKKKTWIIIAVVVLLLICCCCILPFAGYSTVPAGDWEDLLNQFNYLMPALVI